MSSDMHQVRPVDYKHEFAQLESQFEAIQVEEVTKTKFIKDLVAIRAPSEQFKALLAVIVSKTREIKDLMSHLQTSFTDADSLSGPDANKDLGLFVPGQSIKLENIKRSIRDRNAQFEELRRLLQKPLNPSKTLQTQENVKPLVSGNSEAATSENKPISKVTTSDEKLMSLLVHKDSKLVDYETKLAKVTAENEQLKKILTEAVKSKSRLHTQLTELTTEQQKYEESQKRCKEAQQTISKLTKEVGKRGEELKHIENHEGQLKAQIQACKRQNINLENEKAALQNEKNMLERDHSFADRQAELSGLKRKVESRAVQLAALELKIEQLDAEYKKISDENAALKIDCELAAGILHQASGFVARHLQRSGSDGAGGNENKLTTPNKRPRLENDNGRERSASASASVRRTLFSSPRTTSLRPPAFSTGSRHGVTPRSLSASRPALNPPVPMGAHRHDPDRTRTEMEKESDRRERARGPAPGKPHFVNAHWRVAPGSWNSSKHPSSGQGDGNGKGGGEHDDNGYGPANSV